MAEVYQLEARLDAVNVGGAEISAYRVELEQLEAQLRGLANADAEVGIDLDDAAARAGLDRFESDFERLDGMRAEAEVRADVASANTSLGSLERSIERVNDATAEVEATADISRAESALMEVEAQARRLGTVRVEIPVDADTAQAVMQMRGAAALADQIGAKRVEIRVGADTASALSQLGAFEAIRSAVDGKDIDIEVDVDAGGAVASLGAVTVATVASTAAMTGTRAAGAAASAGLQAVGIAAQFLGQGIAASARVLPVVGGALSGMGVAAVSAGAQLVALGPIGIAVAAALVAITAVAAVAFFGALAAAIGLAGAALGALAGVLAIAAAGIGVLVAGVALVAAPFALWASNVSTANEKLKENEQQSEAVKTATDTLRSAQEQHRAALQGVDAAERTLQDQRRGLESATRSLESAQGELNRAFAEEGQRLARMDLDLESLRLDQRDATLRLAEAQKELNRARASGNPTEIARAEIELGRARIDQRRTAMDIGSAEEEINRARRNGTQELQSARQSVKQAYDERRTSARGVADAERGVEEAQRGVRQSAGQVREAQNQLTEASRGQRQELTLLERGWKNLRPEVNRAFGPAIEQARGLGRELGAIGGRLLPALGRASANTLSGIRQGFQDVTREVSPREQNSFGAILNSLDDVFRDLARAGGRFFLGFLNFTADALPEIKGFSRSVAQVAKDFLDWTRSQEGREQIRRFIDEVVPVAREFAVQIGDISVRLLKLARDHGPELVAAVRLIGQVIIGLLDIGDRWLDRISRWGAATVDLVTTVRDWWNKLPGWLREAAEQAVDNVLGPFDDMYRYLLGNSVVPDIINETADWFRSLPGKVADALGNLPGEVGEKFSNAKSQAIDALSGLASDMFTIGKNIVTGLINGVGEMAQAFYDRMREIAGNAVNAFKDRLGIESPSTEARDAMQEFGVGAIIGLDDMTDPVAASARRMAEAVVAEAQSALAAPLVMPSLEVVAEARRRGASPMADGMVRLGEVSEATWENLLDSGWKGRAGDSMEALYEPSAAASPYRERAARPTPSAPSNERLERRVEEMSDRLEAALSRVEAATREVGPSVRESTNANLRGGRRTITSVERGLDRSLRRKQFEGGW